MTESDVKYVNDLIVRHGRQREALIPILQELQDRYRYLPSAAMEYLVEQTEITAADVAGVSTFYKRFRHQEAGRHTIAVCHGTACHIKGAGLVTEALRKILGIADGSDTDPQGLFTLDKVSCLGCCTLAPVVKIDDVIYGHQSPETVAAMLGDFLSQADQPAPSPRRGKGAAPRGEVRIGMGSCCQARGSAKVLAAVEDAVAGSGAAAAVKRVGCVGMCHQTPLLEIVRQGKPAALYACVQPEDAAAIVLRHFAPHGAANRLRTAATAMLDRLLTDEAARPLTRYSLNARDAQVSDFLGPQMHLATEHGGQVDPLDLDEYLSTGGFDALKRCLGQLSPAQIVDTIARSGLRGRGGAGFPTGRKWAAVASGDGPRYLVCNCDEGDPGAFMDRMLLESSPYRIIEGAMIAARAVGAAEGIFYIRHEYPLAVMRLSHAIDTCRRRGLLGKNIFAGDFSLDLRIVEGGGAFVCGEETALIASLEGRRGMPRLRPPYPSRQGLHGRPTLVNNVETMALVPWIIRNGAEAFAAIGTDASKGTKVFALAGKVARGGLIEVPMGATIGQIVNEIGGGVLPGRTLKAVQIGGPSGGCLPAEHLDTPIDFEALTHAGAIMGSGGLVVLDDEDCMVDIARFFLDFTQHESCGKCTFCRVGTRAMLDILEGLCQGRAVAADLARLEELAHQVKAGSLCALGGTAPNPVLTTLRYFRHEYEAHVAGRCPAGVCKALIAYAINDKCIGCTRCAQHCPVGAIEAHPYRRHEIDKQKCIRCGTCKGVCPVGAVEIR
ncbi:MAG: NAD(P)H-dependent oxidoreductase subunit E [Planctomycetaceae bacterium]|nr:NAD(P)H-dependent oxidoreductase subunit E [Planctomycetaceae bacterium]